MAKAKKTLFECQHCGAQSQKWVGKCPQCNSWESYIELTSEQQIALKNAANTHVQAAPIAITDIEKEQIARFSSCENELDLVLGGGIVEGGLYLVGGSPGVGKSTLLLKMAGSLAHSRRVLYVSGEESLGQIRQRAERLDACAPALFLLNDIKLESILAQIRASDFQVVIIDSIQTLFSENLTAAPGSVSQVREVTFALMRLAKEYNIAIFIIGHITKEGAIAGPRILEHMVDVVLYFEGDPSREMRILRGFKNRFGNTSEVGIFEMKHEGLLSAKNAQRAFFEGRTNAAGSAISVALEGSRALVLEVQALVSESSFPRRSTTGFDGNRLNMLLALLERKLEIPLNRYDVFVNIAGGIKINEPSADLAVIAAILSSFKNRPLNAKTIFLGEVSLIGDIRETHNLDARLKEAIAQGFERAILPKKPKTSLPIRCFEATEVTKVIEWM